MFQHINTNAQTKNVWLDCINGHKEHAHCLISLGKEQNISKVEIDEFMEKYGWSRIMG